MYTLACLEASGMWKLWGCSLSFCQGSTWQKRSCKTGFIPNSTSQSTQYNSDMKLHVFCIGCFLLYYLCYSNMPFMPHPILPSHPRRHLMHRFSLCGKGLARTAADCWRSGVSSQCEWQLLFSGGFGDPDCSAAWLPCCDGASYQVQTHLPWALHTTRTRTQYV